MDQQRWRWKADCFEVLELEAITTEKDSGNWIVHVNESAFAWGYRIPLPEASLNHILWRATLQVRHAKDGTFPGIAFRDEAQGILFQVDGAKKTASLRFIEVDKKTVDVQTFDMKKLLYPCELILEYNALTGACGGFIGQARAFDVTLPYRNVPTLPTITAMEIVTSTLKNNPKGEAGYGDLRLDSE